MKLVITCEHGGYKIPAAYKNYFDNEALLKSHRGYDLGALDLFKYLEPLSDASYYSTTSRLLVELNRSLHHRHLFSEFTTRLSKRDKAKILKEYYTPYRTEVIEKITSYIEAKQPVLHLSIHSFTPELNGQKRYCDIGLLYDSRKREEQKFCLDFKIELLKQNPNLNIRFNYPYLGKADGFTTFLRNIFPEHYLGIEIEVNQKFAVGTVMNFEIKKALSDVIAYFKT